MSRATCAGLHQSCSGSAQGRSGPHRSGPPSLCRYPHQREIFHRGYDEARGARFLLPGEKMWAMGSEGRGRTMDPWMRGRRDVVLGGRRMAEASSCDVHLVWAEWGARSGEGEVSWHEQRRWLRRRGWYQIALRRQHDADPREMDGCYCRRHCAGLPDGDCTLLDYGTMSSTK